MAAIRGIGRAAALRILERMLVIRRFEESLVEMSGEKLFKSHYHLYIGQEATAAAVVAAIVGLASLASLRRVLLLEPAVVFRG